MKKNSQIHILIETEIKQKLEKEAKEKGMDLSKLCRNKLGGNEQLDRIEEILKVISREKNK